MELKQEVTSKRTTGKELRQSLSTEGHERDVVPTLLYAILEELRAIKEQRVKNAGE